jgi:hypothetical protein
LAQAGQGGGANKQTVLRQNEKLISVCILYADKIAIVGLHREGELRPNCGFYQSVSFYKNLKFEDFLHWEKICEDFEQ